MFLTQNLCLAIRFRKIDQRPDEIRMFLKMCGQKKKNYAFFIISTKICYKATWLDNLKDPVQYI